MRVRSRSKNQFAVRFVRLKFGSASLTAAEFDRLCSAVERINLEGLAALCTGEDLFTASVAERSSQLCRSCAPNLPKKELDDHATAKIVSAVGGGQYPNDRLGARLTARIFRTVSSHACNGRPPCR